MGPLLPTTSEIGILITTESDPQGLDSLNASLDSTKASFDTLGESADAAAGQVDAATSGMAGAVDGTNDDVIASNAAVADSYKAVGAAADETAAQVDASGAASDVGKGALGTVGLAGAISNPWVLAGAAMAGAITLMIKNASDLQEQIVKLYNTAGETAPLTTLYNGILDVSKATDESTTSLTQALYYISSAGYNTAGGLNVLKAASEGAREEQADLTTVANALTTVMHDYGASTNQSTQYMDELLAATSEGKMTLQDFSSSLSTVLPIAHEVGLSFADVAGAEATLTESGITAQESTQDLHALIQGLETPTATAIKNFQQYGLSSVQLAQDLGTEGLTGTLQEVVAAIDKNIGPSGLVMQQALQSSTVAVQDMNIELKNSPPTLQSLENALVNGTLSFKDFRTESQALPEGMTNLAKQFEATYNQANSFNQALKAGTPAAVTLETALKGVFTQSNSLNAVLALTGSNSLQAATNVDKISKASSNAGKNVSGWSAEQNTLNFQLGDLKEQALAAGDGLGKILLPAITELLKGMTEAIGIADKLASGIGKIWEAISHFKAGAVNVGGSVISTVEHALGGLAIPGFASGITNFGGGLALVGESGPELVYLPQGASVMPNTETGSMMSSSVSSQNTTNNSHQVTIGQVNLSTAAAVSAFITQLDLDNLAVGKGLTASRGVS